MLLVKDWSRRCAQLWRSLHGRRFACYKERKDKGKRHTGWRLQGSMKAVSIMQDKATIALVRMAAADQEAGQVAAPRQTLVGVDRDKMMRRVSKRVVAAPFFCSSGRPPQTGKP